MVRIHLFLTGIFLAAVPALADWVIFVDGQRNEVQAVEIDPASPALASRLVQLQLRSRRYTEAAVTLSEFLDRHPTDPGLLQLADRLHREVGIP